MNAREFLDALDKAHAAATPQPWEHNGNAAHTPVGSCVFTTHCHDKGQRRADAAAIVAAHDALPKLTAALRAVLAKCESMEEEAPIGRFFAVEFRRVIDDAMEAES